MRLGSGPGTYTHAPAILTQSFASEPCFSFAVFSNLTDFIPTCIKAAMGYIRPEPPIPSYLTALLSALNPDGSLTVRDTTPQASCRVLPSPLSELEAKFYYAGLFAAPILVARTSTAPWKVPTGPETYQKLQELRATINKPFDLDREAEIASKREALLDSIKSK